MELWLAMRNSGRRKMDQADKAPAIIYEEAWKQLRVARNRIDAPETMERDVDSGEGMMISRIEHGEGESGIGEREQTAAHATAELRHLEMRRGWCCFLVNRGHLFMPPPSSFASLSNPSVGNRSAIQFLSHLWDSQDVRTHAQDILERLNDGTMPCDTQWTDEQLGPFPRWVDGPMPA